MKREEKRRPRHGAKPQEGATLLALRPVGWEWEEALHPPGVVLESRDIMLTPGGWRYLRARLDPLPPGWPESKEPALLLEIRCVVLAAGMPLPPRHGEGGWLLLSRSDEVAAWSALLLNPHGVHFLNHAQHERYAERWPARVAQLRDFLARHDLAPSRVLIDSSMVLELYGIRPARDIDFLALDPVEAHESPFGANDARLPQHGVDKRVLIEDARYHFEVDGLRFVSFEQLKRLKRGRRRLKDMNDLAMMDALTAGRAWRLVVGRALWRGLVIVNIVRRAALRLARRLGVLAGWRRLRRHVGH